jgi:hypothetical protein
VGIRDRIMGWLDRGEPRVFDPEAVVEIAEVMLHDGPLLVAVLERGGIRAHGTEAFDFIAKGNTRMRILVQTKDAARATELIRDSGVRLQRPFL